MHSFVCSGLTHPSLTSLVPLYVGPSQLETTGIAFSPNGMHMYFAYQQDGYVFDVTRTDGLSFFASTAPPSEELSFLEWIENGIHDHFDWLSTTSSRNEDGPF